MSGVCFNLKNFSPPPENASLYGNSLTRNGIDGLLLSSASSHRDSRAVAESLPSRVALPGDALARNADVLERANRQLLAGLSKLAPLRHIRLLTSQEDIDGIGRELWAHQQVVIQEVEPSWGWDSDSYSEACNRNIERIFPPQDRLRQLQIHGRNGLISKLADSQLSASRAPSFQCVDLRVPWDFVPQQDPLAPVTMAKILRANTRVARLTIEGSNHQARVHGAALRRIQADPTFYSTQPFLASLAACDRLTFLSINRIMFKGGDTLLDILRVVTSLPELRYAVVCPFPISREARDFLRPAPFSVLEVIARANIHLRYLSTMVDLHSLNDIPDIPPDCVFHNSMRSLSLHPCDVRGFPNPTVPGQLKIAQYLARIFPSIHAAIRRELGAGVTGNLSPTPPAQIGFWEPIGYMIAAFQVSRHDPTQTSEVCKKDVGTQTDMTIIEGTS
ncbi:hypothetical protein FA13DRAFT_1798020 [Coprinellus micaceus]|uniref:Uncharacterized protein n=1 Tax=Coprinellus micaceus TaxID=71717 RepID=A0A4Y7SNR3_COPMI|nr:hypothetical protein FA13DRAFT_1798020 [Coprinellus micaceus]